MTLRRLARPVLRYTVAAGGATAFVLIVIALSSNFPLEFLAVLLTLPAMLVAPFILGVESGMESTEAGASAGYIADEPTRTRFAPASFPGRIEFGLYVLGIALAGALLFGATAL